MIEALAISALNPERLPTAGNTETKIYRPLAGGSPPKKFQLGLLGNASQTAPTRVHIGVSNATVSKPTVDLDREARAILARTCAVALIVAIGLAAISYVPGLSFAGYGAALALLAAAFFGSAAADS